jgi:hypothetical protein
MYVRTLLPSPRPRSQHLRLVFYDGAILDTSEPESVAAFQESHASLLAGQ